MLLRKSLLGRTKAAVVAVDSPDADGTYETGATVRITIEFNQVVYATGEPTLALNSGGVAVYVSGSGTTILQFNNVVAEGDDAASLDYVATTSLVATGAAAIRDRFGRPAVLTLPTPGAAGSLAANSDITVDGVATLSAPTGLNVTTGGHITWNAVNGALRYFAERSPAGAGTWTTIGPTFGAQQLYLDDDPSALAAGDYDYRVYAVGTTGNSAYSSVYTVTYTAPAGGAFIFTRMEKIPDFGASPTKTVASSGPWSSGSTWSGGTVPTAADVVNVAAGKTVTLDTTAATCKTLAISGAVVASTSVDTALIFQHLLVREGGTFEVGTSSTPIPANRTATLTVRDVALESSSVDPQQFGNSLISLGRVSIYGAPIASPIVRSTNELVAGTTSIVLDGVHADWAVGHVIYIPDTRQLNYSTFIASTSQGEFRTITGVSVGASTTTLTVAALTYDHKGARDKDGVLRALPHVHHMTRNVTIRSENMNGTRGYCLFTATADDDVHYTRWDDLGRSQVAPFDNTRFNTDGTLAYYGTNQKGRYCDHSHHKEELARNPQVTRKGNVYFNDPAGPSPPRWAVNYHGTSWGLIEDCIAYYSGGAAYFIGEERNEINNVLTGCSSCRVTGTFGRPDERSLSDLGFEAWAYWFGTPLVTVTNCISYEAPGYMYYPRFAINQAVPLFPGACTCDEEGVDWEYVDFTYLPLTAFEDNECWSSPVGAIQPWSVGAYGQAPHTDADESVVLRMRVFNCAGPLVYNYETANVTYRDCLFICDLTAIVARHDAVAIFGGDYQMYGGRVENCEIHNCTRGVYPSSQMGGGTLTVENTIINAYWGVYVSHIGRYTADVLDGSPDPRSIVLDNCLISNLPPSVYIDSPSYIGPSKLISMQSGGSDFTSTHFTQGDEFDVLNWQQQAGVNYHIYYDDQVADAVCPTAGINPNTGGQQTGTAVAGRTNQQAWDNEGLCVCNNGPPPSSYTTLAGVRGKVAAF